MGNTIQLLMLRGHFSQVNRTTQFLNSEMLALVWSVKYFHAYIPCILTIQCCLCILANTQSHLQLTGGQWLFRIDLEICHTSGCSNTSTDTFSRILYRRWLQQLPLLTHVPVVGQGSAWEFVGGGDIATISHLPHIRTK